MEQLLIHLLGDYIFQTEWMASNKTKSLLPAFTHATVYSLPFLFLTSSPLALFVIWLTHLLIDHYRLARYVIFAKNKVTDLSLKWEDCSGTGFHKDVPAWLSVWLMIIVDNTLHLFINYSVLRWLSFDIDAFNVGLPLFIIFGCIWLYAVMLYIKKE